MRISDWSSDVCSSDLAAAGGQPRADAPDARYLTVGAPHGRDASHDHAGSRPWGAPTTALMTMDMTLRILLAFAVLLLAGCATVGPNADATAWNGIGGAHV